MTTYPSRRPILNASLMCADPLNLGTELDALADAGIDMYHCDVMDGVFVPNVTLGLFHIEAIASTGTVPVEAHLMVSRPEEFVDPLVAAGVAFITVHAETTQHLNRLLSRISASNARVGLSLNPATPVSSIQDVIHLVDLLQIMTVNPGFAGQSFLHRSVERVAEARSLLDAEGKPGAILQVDGAINSETIPAVVSAGADALVLGSSSLFGASTDEYANRLTEIRRTADVALAR